MEMFIAHESLGNTLKNSEVKITRPRGPIDAAAAQRYSAIFDKYFTAAAFIGLTAVAEYAALRDRAGDMEADLHRVELDRQAAELEQQRLLASKVSGEQLATALSAADAKKGAASQRLQQANSGARMFRAKLAKAESEARDAIKGRLQTVLASAFADHVARTEKARERLTAAIVPLLNELAALEQAGVELGVHRDLEPRVDELLRTVQAKR